MSLLSGLGEIPAMSPPSGVAPNFVNPENKSLIGVVLGGVMASLMALMIINRAFVKWRVIKKWTKDDLTCVSAFLLGLAYYTVIVIAMQSGNVGVHQYDLKLAHTLDHSYLLACYLSSIFAPMTMIFEKITFLLFYRQLFRPLRWLRIAAFLGVIVTILAYMSFMTVVLVYTTPSKGETFATHYQTLTFEKAIPVGIASSAFGVVIDLYIISLPVMGIHRLKLSPRQRVEVTGLFLTGTL
ncbi:hypothetical protein MMC13_007501 [Lambiella insularis]|nr:hypothetical protein [Lambiella insularis]